MRRDDGGVHVGEIACVVLPYPCLARLAADDEEESPAPKVNFVVSASLAQASGLSTAQTLNGCLLTAVGASRAASKMRPITSCGISLSESARQENRSLMSSLYSI